VYHSQEDGSYKDNFTKVTSEKKKVVGLGQLPIMFIIMIAHAHGDEMFVQYSNEL
jgi:hypothetical protein